MTIRVRCKSCGAGLRIPDHMAGKAVACKSCGSRVRVPGILYDERRVRPRNRRAGGWLKPTLWIGIPLLVVGSVAGLWVLFDGSTAGKDMDPSDITAIKPKAWNVRAESIPQRRPLPRGEEFSLANLRKSRVWSPTVAPELCVVTMNPREQPDVVVYNVISGTKLFDLDESLGWSHTIQISSDARYIVGATSEGKRGRLTVRDRNGRITTIDAGRFMKALVRFLPRNRLLIAANEVVKRDTPVGTQLEPDGPGKVRLWDLETGRLLRSFPTPNSEFNKADVSPGGGYLATVIAQQLTVYDLATGETVGITDLPAGETAGSLELRNLRFSHDGSKLAGYFTESPDGRFDTSNRILCWNFKTGNGMSNVEFDIDVARDAVDLDTFASSRRIEWTEHDEAVVLNSAVIDVKSGRIVWTPFQIKDYRNTKSYKFLRFCDNHSILIRYDEELRRLEIPIDRALKSLAALHANSPAYVKPGQTVSLALRVGEIRYGRKEATEQLLRKALTERLSRLGFKVSGGQPTVFEIDYSEAPGRLLSVIRQDLLKFNISLTPRANEQTIQGTRAVLRFAWTVQGRVDPVWSNTEIVEPNFLFQLSELSNRGAREGSLRKVVEKLLQLPVPYFIAKRPELVPLPVRKRLDKPPRS